MAHPRELLPVSVYLPPAAIAEADERAAEQSIPRATLLRQIMLGREKPLGLSSAARKAWRLPG